VETMLAEDRVALNLLYTQAIWEVERGWVLATKDIRNKLSSLQSRGEKKEVYCNQNMLNLNTEFCHDFFHSDMFMAYSEIPVFV
jgi:hypothetical protein